MMPCCSSQTASLMSPRGRSEVAVGNEVLARDLRGVQTHSQCPAFLPQTKFPHRLHLAVQEYVL